MSLKYALAKVEDEDEDAVWQMSSMDDEEMALVESKQSAHVFQCESLVVCDVDAELVTKLKKFRFRKETNNAAIVMKIDKERQMVILEEEHEDEKSERSLAADTFIVYSYKYEHQDGRVSYPLCFIFSSPVGCHMQLQMMYAGSKNKLVHTAELTKVFEIRNTEDLTEEWLRDKLGFFS
ncbi:glia maturation factor beta [Neosynchiropus ocellatus]